MSLTVGTINGAALLWSCVFGVVAAMDQHVLLGSICGTLLLTCGITMAGVLLPNKWCLLPQMICLLCMVVYLVYDMASALVQSQSRRTPIGVEVFFLLAVLEGAIIGIFIPHYLLFKEIQFNQKQNQRLQELPVKQPKNVQTESTVYLA